jgi:hypothetical protein
MASSQHSTRQPSPGRARSATEAALERLRRAGGSATQNSCWYEPDKDYVYVSLTGCKKYTDTPTASIHPQKGLSVIVKIQSSS